MGVRQEAPPSGVDGVGGCVRLCVWLQPTFPGVTAGTAARRGGSLGRGQPSGMQRHCPSQQGGPSARRLGWRACLWLWPPATIRLHTGCPTPAGGA